MLERAAKHRKTNLEHLIESAFVSKLIHLCYSGKMGLCKKCDRLTFTKSGICKYCEKGFAYGAGSVSLHNCRKKKKKV
jgi:hypothetical protein